MKEEINEIIKRNSELEEINKIMKMNNEELRALLEEHPELKNAMDDLTEELKVIESCLKKIGKVA